MKNNFDFFDGEELRKDKPILIRTESRDGFILFDNIHIQTCGTLLNNNIIGPLKYDEIFNYYIIPPTQNKDEKKIISILEKNEINLEESANKYLGIKKNERYTLGHSITPYQDWLCGININDKKLKNMIGYYIIGFD